MPEQIRFHRFPVMGIEAMSASTSHVFPRHTHDRYGIGVVDAGGHASLSDRGQVEAGPGGLICVNPGEVHDGRPSGGVSRSWRIVYLEPTLMRGRCREVSEGRSATLYFAAPVFADETLRALFNQTFVSTESMACESGLLMIVARMRARWTVDRAPSRTTGCIRRARERIDSNPAEPHTLSDLANEGGLSRYQLLRSFARELRLTPHAYLLQQRIALAHRLIRQGGRPQAEIAIASGFFDQSHFSRCFARQFGVSPRRYAAQRA
ncbi:MAG TPA: AraC family transcriptional regulator [Steroidobacteraceae bacterium]|jgi:AraC-like DNA-binding protein|nr:AraC family transcriptional regulator [Steroidobacteraceae bacterium]